MREILSPFSGSPCRGCTRELSTGRLLVMDEVAGRAAPRGAARRRTARGGPTAVEAFYRQVLPEGFFHADPHPGNLLWADDQINFLDLGMIGDAQEDARELLLLLLLAFWRGDRFLADVLLMLGEAARGRRPGGAAR